MIRIAVSFLHANQCQGLRQDNQFLQLLLYQKKFVGSKLHEDCKSTIRKMVLRNPLEFMYIKSVDKYVLCFCSHALCPIIGMNAQAKVSGNMMILYEYSDY